MARDFRNFLRILTDCAPGEPSLFEPFIDFYISEHLIWRRGKHLWEENDIYIDSLISLSDCTGAEIIIPDLTKTVSKEEMLSVCDKRMTDTLRFVPICENISDALLACSHESVCAVAILNSDEMLPLTGITKPAISLGGDINKAIELGYSGYHTSSNAEEYIMNYSDRIAILGGIGADYIKHEQPITIHERIQKIFNETKNVRYAVGSGGTVGDDDYLGYISMLGIYRKFK